MKRIILTESQYKRLIKKRLNEQKVVFKDPKDEYDITNEMMQLLIHLKFYIDTTANKSLYIDKVENGVIYIDSSKYTQEEKQLINDEIDNWISFTNISTDKRSEDLTYDFGVDTDWYDLHPNDDIAVVDDEDNSTTDDVDLDDNSTAEVEEEIDISDIQACKWGKNASGIDRKVVLPPKEDIQFYKDVLKGIGANVTCEKMLFFFAWRSGESSDSSFNPFATTYKDTDNECCYFNCLKNGVGYKPIACRTCPEGTNPGVRNYTNKKAGIKATVNTLKARYYPTILSKLKNDNSTAMDLASETRELSIWGTGSLPKQILEKNSTVRPKEIKEYAGECGAAVVTTDCELTSEEIKFYDKHIRTNEDNLNFRYWVNQDSNRKDKVNKKLLDCGLPDPKLDIIGEENDHLEIAFALIGKDWVNEGKPKKPEEEVVDDDVIYDSNELLTWSERAKKDRDAGIINPILISDIIKALKAINMRAQISWARTGHSKYTNSGSISRHWSGNAVDISVIEGVGNPEGKGSNKGIGNANFMKNGDRLVAELQKMGYTFGERGKTKGYLWRTNTGGNHWNHVHVSNKDRKKKVGTEIPKKSETKGNELPPKVQKLMEKLKTDYGVIITQSHIDKEYEQEGYKTRPDNGGVNAVALTEIKKLISDCKKANPIQYPKDIVSGYRSYDEQVRNFGTKVRDNGRTIENVQASNCLPGFTQHHTGRAFDIFSVDTSWWDKNPKVKKWVADNCKKYGFKVTYTKPNQLRIPEPWHLFYIG
jgi:LAS superfamily LD-carboxypeptidase LdcB